MKESTPLIAPMSNGGKCTIYGKSTELSFTCWVFTRTLSPEALNVLLQGAVLINFDVFWQLSKNSRDSGKYPKT